MARYIEKRQIWSNGKNEIEVIVEWHFRDMVETWFFSVNGKDYFYQKPHYAKARLAKLGYEYSSTASRRAV